MANWLVVDGASTSVTSVYPRLRKEVASAENRGRRTSRHPPADQLKRPGRIVGASGIAYIVRYIVDVVLRRFDC
jgi:hypothetical protein